MTDLVPLPSRLPSESEVEDVLIEAFDRAYYGDPSNSAHVPYEADDTITLAAIARRALCDAGYLKLLDEELASPATEAPVLCRWRDGWGYRCPSCGMFVWPKQEVAPACPNGCTNTAAADAGDN